MLDGSDSRQQLLVTRFDNDNLLLDLTREVRLIAKPEGLVRISGGLVEPLSNGKGKIYIDNEVESDVFIPFEVGGTRGYQGVPGIHILDYGIHSLRY